MSDQYLADIAEDISGIGITLAALIEHFDISADEVSEIGSIEALLRLCEYRLREIARTSPSLHLRSSRAPRSHRQSRRSLYRPIRPTPSTKQGHLSALSAQAKSPDRVDATGASRECSTRQSRFRRMSGLLQGQGLLTARKEPDQAHRTETTKRTFDYQKKCMCPCTHASDDVAEKRESHE